MNKFKNLPAILLGDFNYVEHENDRSKGFSYDDMKILGIFNPLNPNLIDTYNSGPDSLVDKASASGAGGRRFDSQCRLVKRNCYQFLACLVPGKRMGFGK